MKESILFDEFWSHPNKLLENHIKNMISAGDEELDKQVKLYHDIAKLKNNFQIYIRDTSNDKLDKNHSFLSAYFFLLNSKFDEIPTLFGFLAIVSHHGDAVNLMTLARDANKFFKNLKELEYWEEVVNAAKNTQVYSGLSTKKDEFLDRAEKLRQYLILLQYKHKFTYEDFINFKSLYSNLVYSDKFEAIFSMPKQETKDIPVDVLESDIKTLPPNKKRDEFRNFVLNNFDENYKLFTLTAPTGYGKTLTALNFALKFNKSRIIYALPFTSIIDQTYDIIAKIYKNSDISVGKAHHKTTIDEKNLTEDDRYSKIKFLMESFSGEINVTTLYQLIFALFGNKNKDNVKFNQLKNSVVIIDEAQAIPYNFRKDFILLCEIISQRLGTIFIFMSATMPVIKSENFKEISNLEYFSRQDRYVIKWLDISGEEGLLEKICETARDKNTLVVVNTIKKAQELFVKLRDKFSCFCLNGYMYDDHKRATIEAVRCAINTNKDDPLASKILLISTQSIEAGVDLDFDVGFREVAPISSIIQTAGRVNRHFGEICGELYVFAEISKFTNLIYGDLQKVSKAILEIFKQREVRESEILEISNLYFQKISDQLENLYIQSEIKKLEFENINQKIEEIMNDNCKQTLIIEPEENFIKDFEAKIIEIKNSQNNEFTIRDILKNHIRKLSKFSINVTFKDKEKLTPNLRQIRGLKDMFYLPFGSSYFYSTDYGLKKDTNLDITDEVFD
ncbi:CRISPR/Cas system-associated endonuclease/helicase Cas3, type I-B/HMARI [Campylobacter showae]|uniref:CRISPR-associated helicase Cas3 n=1 Tax=Campylobacter showae RM3277 TaxID=553219 RepID=C6RIW1_9BACT|nr:CRISPR-associated helicase/endonuclease Cas3 [Campylobacter showae]EET78542.1 CRISPR-associated helicase Cas3 [Campylobacter showae RM3277]QCD49888.1 CRISPR/Cas system-associated endonuclease/helicase Cas3, type I-B/HMARI [Campylobacter showae]